MYLCVFMCIYEGCIAYIFYPIGIEFSSGRLQNSSASFCVAELDALKARMLLAVFVHICRPTLDDIL